MGTAADAIRVLRFFKNAILEGPPGTGKTYVVSEIAALWPQATQRTLGGDGDGKYAITFHPSTTYEEFIEGLRYDDDPDSPGFKRRDGFLMNVIKEAQDFPEKDFLVLLDEINRANVPKVLGDVLLCMESTKRSTNVPGTKDWRGGSTVTLPYSGRLFSIPDNVYLLGTMNTSDRSIAPLDSALRRRFGFVRVDPLGGAALTKAIESVDGEAAATRMARSVNALSNLNAVLRDCLGPDAMLGHSYLFGVSSTAGRTSNTPDPLEAIRTLVDEVQAEAALWLEVASTSGGSGNQLDIPDQKGNRPGLQAEFYPMSSDGAETITPSERGLQDALDIHFGGRLLVRNTLEYNRGGSNYRFKYQGRTADEQGIYDLTPRGSLEQKVHVFVRRPDHTYDLLLMDRDPTVVTALRGVSIDPGWIARTMPGANGRDYGVINLAELAKTGSSERSPDEDAEWIVWRYAILPQLIDTVAQLGVPDLLDPAKRDAALSYLGKEDLGERFATFDNFLTELPLYLVIEGHGLSRGVVVSEAPMSTPSQVAPPETDEINTAVTDEPSEDEPAQ